MRLYASAFEGRVPAAIATCAKDGTPNVSFISHVHLVDDSRVALSHQFFSKTRVNVRENPYASALITDPVSGRWLRLKLRYDHEETAGPLFDAMALRIEAIASEAGMEKIFKLCAADVFEVIAFEEMLGSNHSDPRSIPARPQPVRVDLCGLRVLSDRINRAADLETLLRAVLEVMEGVFGFDHSMVLLADEKRDRLFTVASRGYAEAGVGAEVRIGEGIIGTAAKKRQMVHITDLDRERRYARAVRERAIDAGEACGDDVPLPALDDVDSRIALPLVVRESLVGVLAIESERRLPLGADEAAFLGIVANHVAMAIERESERSDSPEPAPAPRASAMPAVKANPRQFCLYRADDCIFVDGEYLIRNVPARILWTLLQARAKTGRTEFTNRELRLDASIGLPELKDNLESRLILLRKRLEQKYPDVRIVPVARGRFELEMDRPFEMTEK
jgi:hypothetical protein